MGGEPRPKRRRRRAPTDRNGRIGKYSERGRAQRDRRGRRLSQREHVRDRATLDHTTKDPRTKKSAYPGSAYRRSVTLTVPVDMSKEKDKLDAARLRRLKKGLPVDLSVEADIDRTKRARDIAKRKRRRLGLSTKDLDEITDTKITVAAHAQSGDIRHSPDVMRRLLADVPEEELHRMVDDAVEQAAPRRARGSALVRPPSAASSAPTPGVKPASRAGRAGRAAAKSGRTAVKAAGFLGMAMPDPTDALMLTADVLLAPMEAREQLRTDAYEKAYPVGAAAALVGLPPRLVKRDLMWRGRSGDVATRVIRARGLAEAAHNDGVQDGYRYVRGLPVSVRQRIELQGWERAQSMPAAVARAAMFSTAARRALATHAWSDIRRDPERYGLTSSDVVAYVSIVAAGTADLIAERQRKEREAEAKRRARERERDAGAWVQPRGRVLL